MKVKTKNEESPENKVITTKCPCGHDWVVTSKETTIDGEPPVLRGRTMGYVFCPRCEESVTLQL